MELHIKEARVKAGLKQSELAEMLGVNQSTFSGYESGLHDPKSALLMRIADICDVTVDYLLGLSTEINQRIKQESITEDEESLLTVYRSMNQQGKDTLYASAETFAGMAQFKKITSYSQGEKSNLA